MGLGEPIAISAEHGQGLDGVFHALKDLVRGGTEGTGRLERASNSISAVSRLRLAIVGRPNVGKSTLVNALLGEERMLTGPEAGITRDAVASNLSSRAADSSYGIRRGCAGGRGISDKLENLRWRTRYAPYVLRKWSLSSWMRRWRSKSRTCRLPISWPAKVVHWSLPSNKWDEVADKQAAAQDEARYRGKLPQVCGVPLAAISALRGQGLERLLKAVLIGLRCLEQAHPHLNAESLARRNSARPQSAAGPSRPTDQDQVHDTGQRSTTHVYRFLLQSEGTSGVVSPVPGQPTAR